MYCDWPLLGRCCFCMPLRRGVLTFGYIHIFFVAFMIGMYSFSVNRAITTESLVYGRFTMLPAEVCVAFYCFDFIFDAMMIYGAHKKAVMCLKAFYYYTIATSVALLVMQLLSIFYGDRFFINAIEMCVYAFSSLCIQMYLVTLVYSLIRKLEASSPHGGYSNPLNALVRGEARPEPCGIYQHTTAPAAPRSADV